LIFALAGASLNCFPNLRAKRRGFSFTVKVSAPRKIQNLALIGFMGTGKTAVGRVVADLLRFRLIDTDELIEQRAKKTIAEIFAKEGEAAFREQERQIVEELGAYSKCVFSTGGGLPANFNNLDSLKTHALTVCLWASPERIWERVRNQSHRPLLNDPNPLEKIRSLLAARAQYYRQADVLVNTEMRNVREVAQQVIHQFHMAQSAHK
jgi:shikimate kinase